MGYRRGNLRPSRLAVGTVAIDGKNAGTVHWHDLCRIFGLDPKEAAAVEVKERLAEQYPEAQLCVPSRRSPTP